MRQIFIIAISYDLLMLIHIYTSLIWWRIWLYKIVINYLLNINYKELLTIFLIVID